MWTVRPGYQPRVDGGELDRAGGVGGLAAAQEGLVRQVLGAWRGRPGHRRPVVGGWRVTGVAAKRVTVPHLDLAVGDRRTVGVGQSEAQPQCHAVAVLDKVAAQWLGAAPVRAFELLGPLAAHDGGAGEQIADCGADRIRDGHDSVNSRNAA